MGGLLSLLNSFNITGLDVAGILCFLCILVGTSNNQQFAGSLRTHKSCRRGGIAGESCLDH
jgi:predicted branched-subunit amino acid permease